MSEQTQQDIVERIFREGYQAGYREGGSDTAAFECGSGSKHPATLERNLVSEWQDSESFKLVGAIQAAREALKQFSQCELSDANCVSWEVANKRIRSIANKALALLNSQEATK